MGSKKKPTEATTELLGEARVAVQGGRLRDALVVLLEAWRRKQAVEIAGAIDTVGALAVREEPAPRTKTREKRRLAWAEAARSGDPVARQWVVQALTDTRGCVATLERVRLILEPSDPRVATAVASLIEKPEYSASSPRTEAFWREIFGLLPKLGDARVLARARGFVIRWSENGTLSHPDRMGLLGHLQRALPAIERAYRHPPALTDEEAAMCAKLGEATVTLAG